MAYMITAHSGCENTDRDSIESIDIALQYNADAIEIDVRRALDGQLRISHNRLSEEEYLGKATLDDVFEKVKNTYLLINCDIKEPAALYYVLDKAKDFGIKKDRLIITGCTSAEQIVRDPFLVENAQLYVNLEQILKYDFFKEHQFKDLAEFLENLDEPTGDVKYEFVMDSETIDKVISYCKLLKVYGVNLPYQVLTEEFAKRLNDANVLFSVWTVNDRDLALHLLEMNVANITTRSIKDIISTRNTFVEGRLTNG